jgi:glycosyltransferase involved in cell wall biosynthesis
VPRVRAVSIAPVSDVRIVHLIDMTPAKAGPVELQTLATARHATSRGFDFAAYFSGPIPDTYREQMRALGARVGNLDATRWEAEAATICARERPTIAHFHFGPHAGFSQAARHGARVVLTEHSPRPRRSAHLVRMAVRHWRTRPVDRFIAVSQFIARQTIRDFGVGRSRIRVILNATDIDRFRPRPEDRLRLRRELLGLGEEHVVVTMAAHMRPAKRQWMAVVAMAEILEEAPNARLVLAGDGPEREKLRELVDAGGLATAVQILSGPNDVAALYAASDLAILPSISEGLPGGAIEALAAGLPIVATPNGGTPEVYEDGVSGISVRDQTSHGLATALTPLIADAMLRKRMGRAARRRAEELFSIDRPARETLSVYDELL